MISYDDFLKLDIRVGTIVAVEDFPEARHPAYKLTIDFGGDVGIKTSSSQIVTLYTKDELLGSQVLGVVNFPEKKIGPFISQVLTLGLKDASGSIVLVQPTHEVPNGERLL